VGREGERALRDGARRRQQPSPRQRRGQPPPGVAEGLFLVGGAVRCGRAGVRGGGSSGGAGAAAGRWRPQRPRWRRGGVRRDGGDKDEQVGAVEAAPQARAGKSELPRTAWLIPGVLKRSSACLAVPLTCIAVCV